MLFLLHLDLSSYSVSQTYIQEYIHTSYLYHLYIIHVEPRSQGMNQNDYLVLPFLGSQEYLI